MNAVFEKENKNENTKIERQGQKWEIRNYGVEVENLFSFFHVQR